jgi:cellulose synthase/poly-beta-1,6-N-acetylglucosamine synthase-like glycosyltransferase
MSALMIGLIGLLVLPLLVPAIALLVLVLAALGSRTTDGLGTDTKAPRVAVLVPAHNESAHLLPTLRNLQAQLGPRDRLLVVADNCSDDTAAVARAAGAEVTERHDLRECGKGFALAHGVADLRTDPPDVVLVVDADCQISDGGVARIAAACQATGRPVQMLDLMTSPEHAGLRLRVTEFAMVMKNLVRPLGTRRLGGVCHLMGTGMALPWPLMAAARLATGHVAEDMQLGIELTKAGRAPLFLPEARVGSRFVHDTAAVRRQKARWEHGHLDSLRQELPGLVGAAWRQRSPALAALALDLCIPPVALYFCSLVTLLGALLAAAWIWPVAQVAAVLASAAAAAFALAIGLAWWHFGRHLLRGRELLGLPLYALWKLPVYLSYALGAHSGWLRTPRAASAANAKGPQP